MVSTKCEVRGTVGQHSWRRPSECFEKWKKRTEKCIKEPAGTRGWQNFIVDFRYDDLSQDVKLVLVSCYNMLCY